MNICGILISKEKSNRFPYKNRLLFKKNAEILIELSGVENVYMFTDDLVIKSMCEDMGIKIIDKNCNFNDEFYYLDALRFSYFSIDKKYDVIATILCASINHTIEPLYKAIEIIKNDNNITEVRGFDNNGEQSGLFVFNADKLPEKWHHMAAVKSPGKEIHYRSELDG